jgi:hypothetical protein
LLAPVRPALVELAPVPGLAKPQGVLESAKFLLACLPNPPAGQKQALLVEFLEWPALSLPKGFLCFRLA